MKYLTSAFVICCCIVIFTACGNTNDDSLSAESYPEFTLRGSQVRPFHSEKVDEDYKLHISLPPGYDKASDRYPVLYLTDSDSFFGFVRIIARTLQYQKSIPNIIIVGIGYKETGKVAWDNRARDHLPAKHEDIPAAGGAGKYLAFLQEELIPYIETNFRVKSDDRIFAGMSSGGTLGAFTLVTAPETFSRYLIVSPALHTGNEMIIDLEKKYADLHNDLPARVYTALGEHEPDIMSVGWNDFVAGLEKSNYSGLELTSEIIDDGTHMDAVYSAYVRGLKAVFDDWD
ncbi:MAG: alpha/beta hydrolase [FCB group bacterium]|nr:alpha/beta hydrolase [FCB group bacterium]